MSDAVVASAISAAAVIIAALATFYANARLQAHVRWREQKISYYQDYFDALATFVGGPVNAENELALAREANNLHLIASTTVLDRLHDYQSFCRDPEKNADFERHNILLARLISEARRDLGLVGRELKARHINLLSFSGRR